MKDSKTKKAIKYSLTFFLILDQPTKRQAGIRKVVKTIKYIESPSTPKTK